MKALNIIITFSALLVLTACELPDVKGMNKMPKQTQEMSDKMDDTNEGIRLQKLFLAMEGLNKYENQQLILPLPTGLLAFGKKFAENATSSELVELTYNWISEIEEIIPINGLDKNSDMTELTEADLNKIRLQKTARLYSLMIIAGFAQEEKVDEIIKTEIRGYGRFQQYALNFLGLRAYFLREVMLKTSLKIDSSSDKTLSNSGMMNTALHFLTQLDKISKLPFADQVGFNINEKYYNMISVKDYQDAEGRKKTADMWKLALEKALTGQQSYQTQTAVQVNSLGSSRDEEIARQDKAIQSMKSHSNSWEGKLN